MIIPQGVAYAALAGMPLITGIYASMLPALVAVLWSSSTRLSVGPTALSSLLVASSLTGLAEPGSARWVELAVWLALLSGLAQVGLGFMRFGWLLNLVSSPVLMAFTQAAAVLILLSQLPALLGFKASWSQMLAQPRIDWAAAGFGLGSLAALVLARRWRPGFPTVVVVVVAAAALSRWSRFATAGRAIVGQLPAGLPALYRPSLLDWHELGQLMIPALVVTLVSFLETASSAKVDNQRGGRRWDQNQDLIGQGLAKIASGLSGSFPTSSSFSRSALNLYVGARTGWATLVSVAIVVLALLLFTPVLRYVPQAVLAAIIVAATVGLLKPREFARLWRISRVETATSAVTFAITLLTAPRLYWGVIAGLVMGLSHFCTSVCIRASSRQACTPMAACATATCGNCPRWHRVFMPCAWMPGWTLPPPTHWSVPLWSIWPRTRTCSTSACSPNPSTGLTRPASRCSCSWKPACRYAASSCTSAASSCRWRPCCEKPVR